MLEYLQSCLRAAEMEAAQAAGAASPVQGLMSERENAGEAHPQHRELQAANAQLEVGPNTMHLYAPTKKLAAQHLAAQHLTQNRALGSNQSQRFW